MLGGLNSVSSSRPTTSGDASRPISQYYSNHNFSSNNHISSHLNTYNEPYKSLSNINRSHPSLLVSAGRSSLSIPIEKSISSSSLQSFQQMSEEAKIDYSAYGF